MTDAPHADSSRAPGTALEVELSSCCGALPGDVCPCDQDAADVAQFLRKAIHLGRTHRPPPGKEEFV